MWECQSGVEDFKTFICSRQGHPNPLGQFDHESYVPYNGKLIRPMDVSVRVGEVCPCSVWDKMVLFCPVFGSVGQSDKMCASMVPNTAGV
jgi:hypothetical protein